MRQSLLFTKVRREAPRDEESMNAQLLIRAGFVHKEMAGVYTLLPLGLKTVRKIENIVRKEMEAAGGQEISMPSLHSKSNWQKTGRWNTFDALLKLKSSFSESEYALGPTHEEIAVPLMKDFIFSYKDLPRYVFQIQTKFRDEKRAKSGLLRGREFLMKDMYSFHSDESDLEAYYETMRKSYKRIFETLGLTAIETKASGGSFSEFSHEYQVITNAGEDEIVYCKGGDFAENVEICKVKEGKQCDAGHGPLQKAKAIEVGNIFKLGTKFSEAFELKYKDAKGKEHYVSMGCYGLGITRLLGAIAEVFHDEKGMIWPQSVAPALIHLIALKGGEQESEKLYRELEAKGVEVLYDDRQDASAGEKFSDADLIGLPFRAVTSAKTAEQKSVEIKKRTDKEGTLVKIQDIGNYQFV